MRDSPSVNLARDTWATLRTNETYQGDAKLQTDVDMTIFEGTPTLPSVQKTACKPFCEFEFFVILAETAFASPC